jgi:ribonucleoside-diphosphate reductase alpha chain
MTKRLRLPATRHGRTYKIECGGVTMYVTVNSDEHGRPLEMFGKADEGSRGFLDAICLTASMGMQYGCPLADILKKWRGMRFPPDQIGKGSSLPDAVARALWSEFAGEETEQ